MDREGVVRHAMTTSLEPSETAENTLELVRLASRFTLTLTLTLSLQVKLLQSTEILGVDCRGNTKAAHLSHFRGR